MATMTAKQIQNWTNRQARKRAAGRIAKQLWHNQQSYKRWQLSQYNPQRVGLSDSLLGVEKLAEKLADSLTASEPTNASIRKAACAASGQVYREPEREKRRVRVEATEATRKARVAALERCASKLDSMPRSERENFTIVCTVSGEYKLMLVSELDNR